MFKLLGGLKEYLKWQDITTDNAIFRLHNTFTTVLLMACSLVITATQYVGSPIQCIVNGLPTHPINTYCWITSTFTMPDAFRRQVGVEVAHPGVGNDFGDEDAKKYYTYYQWVCFVLFFQAILCYTPKFIWDAWEGGLLRTIVMGLNIGMCHEEEKNKKKKTLIDYLLRHIQMKSNQRGSGINWYAAPLMPFMSVLDERHNYYAMRYWFCECLCLVNIIVQLYFMNRFFDGEFLQYGLKVMSMSEDNQESRYDPMVYIFPRVTKCTFHKYGASGSIQKHDSLCILPLNIVNEKTYIFIWFWFMILLTLLSLLVVYRILIICCPSIRPRLLRARNRMVPHEVASAICRKVDIGDWWVLYMLGRNMDPLIYREMIMELVKKIETHASNQ